MTKLFAPEFNRGENGWIILPDDVSWRKSLFPTMVMKHLAKMQLYLEKSIIEYVSECGDVVLDPMAGTGTVMLAAVMGRPTICIEIEGMYHKIQCEVLNHLRQHNPDMANVSLINGNCKVVLPIQCNHIIFSPPYAAAFKPSKKLSKIVADKYRVNEDEYTEYARTTGNVGLMNTFLYNMEMEKVYKLCYKSLQPGGTLTIVTKDIIENGKRVLLTKWIQSVCEQTGFVLQDWFKTEQLGGPWQDIRRSKGLETVNDEDITIWRKK